MTGVTSNDRISRLNRMLGQDRPSTTTHSGANMDSATTSTLLMMATTTGGMAAIRALAYLYSWIHKNQQPHRRGLSNQATVA